MDDDLIFEQLAAATREEDFLERAAPARLLSLTYSAMIAAQQESGPLQDVTSTKQAGHPLCVFEELVQIAPVGKPAKQLFYCSVCHARVLAEHMESAPIWWPHCPYSQFQK